MSLPCPDFGTVRCDDGSSIQSYVNALISEKYKRIVAVGGVPETATVEKLQEVFPDARVKFIALKPDGTPKW